IYPRHGPKRKASRVVACEVPKHAFRPPSARATEFEHHAASESAFERRCSVNIAGIVDHQNVRVGTAISNAPSATTGERVQRSFYPWTLHRPADAGWRSQIIDSSVPVPMVGRRGDAVECP